MAMSDPIEAGPGKAADTRVEVIYKKRRQEKLVAPYILRAIQEGNLAGGDLVQPKIILFLRRHGSVFLHPDRRAILGALLHLSE